MRAITATPAARHLVAPLAACGVIFAAATQGVDASELPNSLFQAGAAAVDITPTKFPVIVNGFFEERLAYSVHDPLYVRSLVLDDGKLRIAIVVVDSCVLPRDLLDQAKELAHRATGIPSDHILISATHAHSAPSVMGALGSDVDAEYQRFPHAADQSGDRSGMKIL